MQSQHFERNKRSMTYRRPPAKKWHFEDSGLSPDCGVIRHGHAPYFSAIWVSGKGDVSGVSGDIYVDEGSGEGDDRIQIVVQFTGKKPDEGKFKELMHDTVRAIEEWIMANSA